MKICITCNIEQDDSEFYTKRNQCKNCRSIYNKKYIRSDNSKKLKQLSDKKYYEMNKEAISAHNREYKNQYSQEYYNKNKKIIFEKEKQRYKNDVQFRLSKIYRNRMNSYIKGEKDNMKYLQCNLDEFIKFIEIQFVDDMNWDNQSEVWELDHILPVSKFNLEILEHKNICFHWCNYKPILKTDNKKKSNKLVDNIIKEHTDFALFFIKENNQLLNYINIYDFYKENILVNRSKDRVQMEISGTN